MKNIIAIVALLAVGFTSEAQSKADYEKTVAKFQKYYNSHQMDSICYMCANPNDQPKTSHITKEQLDHFMSEFGELNAYKYVPADEPHEGVMLFQTDFRKSSHVMGISLNKDKKIEKIFFNVDDKPVDSLHR